MAKFQVEIEYEFVYTGEIEAEDEDMLRTDIDDSVDDFISDHDLRQEPGHIRIDITPMDEAGDDDEV